MPHSGQQPGKGLYECDDCDNVVFLTNKKTTLPLCYKCHGTKFIRVDFAQDRFYGYIPDLEDQITIRLYKYLNESEEFALNTAVSSYIN